MSSLPDSPPKRKGNGLKILIGAVIIGVIGLAIIWSIPNEMITPSESTGSPEPRQTASAPQPARFNTDIVSCKLDGLGNVEVKYSVQRTVSGPAIDYLETTVLGVARAPSVLVPAIPSIPKA